MSVKRWWTGDQIERDNGDWVSYDDHSAALAPRAPIDETRAEGGA